MGKINYIFDTNCFYHFNKTKIDINKVKKDKANICSVPISIIEILKIDEEKDFKKRRNAMINLADLTTKPINDTPDDIFSISFGLDHPQKKKPINWGQIISTMICANNHAELLKGVKIGKNKNSLKTGVVVNWKKEESKIFIDRFVQSDREQINKIKREIRKKENIKNDKILNKKAKIRFKEILKMDVTYCSVITGLSVRAGLITEEAYITALKDETMKKFDELMRKAVTQYNLSLETYIKVFLQYRNDFCGQIPHRNDIYDLDFLSYLDIFKNAVLVTTEKKKWITIAEKVCPGKLLHVDDFYNKYKF